jgi:flagellar biosynthetic protein FlhB
MWYFGRSIFNGLIEATQFYFGSFSQFGAAPDAMLTLAFGASERIARILLPFVIAMVVAGLAINFIQVGFLFAPKMLAPRFNRINPISGFRKFFSLRSFLELVKSLLKLVLVTYIVYLTARSRVDQVFAAANLTPLGATAAIAALVSAVWFRAALAMLVLGILDFGYQYWQYQQDLRMSVQEAKEEAQQLEGNPRIKQRIRQIQRQMAMRRMMADVPKADVIITNPVTYAVALRYDMDTMDAPLVIAKGARLLAKRIREIGEENDVPIVEKPDLARALYKNIDVGKPVPENLFRAVAEVLSFVYKIDRREEKRRERERTMASLAPAH